MLVLTVLFAPAWAHVGLADPPPRYPSDGYSDNKACPCGVGANNGLCSVDGERSDPNRDAARVTQFTSGQTITVRFNEVIGHSGRWRIAFDDDGADMEDFNANVLLDEPDPTGNDGNMGQGDLWEFEVTLPDVGCDNCTLQVIQVMDGNTTDPVLDPVGRSTYYQCADLELVGGPVDTGPDTEPTTDPTTGTSGDTGNAEDRASDGGCGCATSAPPSAAWIALGLAWLGLRREI